MTTLLASSSVHGGRTKPHYSTHELSFSDLNRYDHHLSAEMLSFAAQHVYAQGESWACVPHSAARALLYRDKLTPDEVSSFIENCPKSIGNDNSNGAKAATAAGLVLGGPVGAGIGLFVGYVADKFMERNPVGPNPKQLTQYVDRGATLHTSESFDADYLEGCVREGRTCIELLMYKPLLMHYVVITGVTSNKSKFAYLDTNNKLYEISRDALADLMDCSSHTLHALGSFAAFNYMKI